MLDPLDTPCALCRHRRAEVNDPEEDTGVERMVCRRCHDDRRMGRWLLDARWMVIRDTLGGTQDKWVGVAGLGVFFENGGEPRIDGATIYWSDLRSGSGPKGLPRDRFLDRRLARHVPAEGGKPLEFIDLASRATGDKLLGILKMDADSLGVAIHKLLVESTDLKPLGDFSKRLDDFFAETLDKELNNNQWNLIYTVFAGGDDLLLVGPWDILLDYAGHVHRLFHKEFDGRLTLSAGMELIKPRHPIKPAASEAERLLYQAKNVAARGAAASRDQCATLGQIWKWQDHDAIIKAAKDLTRWVQKGVAQRGWIHTLLVLAEAREDGVRDPEGDQTSRLLATSRLAYHVARNYPRLDDRDPDKAAMRRWADSLVADFDSHKTMMTIYLPAIARYALAATRSKKEEV